MPFDFPPSKIDRHSEEELAAFRDLYERGRDLHRAVFAYAETNHLENAYAVWMARSPGDRLTDSEITQYSDDLVGEVVSPQIVSNPDSILTTLRGVVVPTIREVLDKGEARTFLTVGVYLGIVDYYLAKHYPHISFVGVDFWKDLEQANAPTLLPNRRVIRGYPLDMIERGEAAGDVVLFFSTAARIKNAELRRYLRALHRSRYFILNEPIFPLPTGEILDPDSIDPHNSRPTVVYPNYAPARNAGYPPCLVHNYRALLEDAGLRILRFNVDHKQARVEAVAERGH